MHFPVELRAPTVGLVGTHSVGKTTLAELASKELGLPIARTDRARDIAKHLQPGRRLDQITPEAQWELQQVFIACAEAIQSQPGPYITDCNGVTCAVYGPGLMGQDRFDEYGLDAAILMRQARQSPHAVSHLCYLPPEADLHDDGFRPLCPDLRFDFDAGIRREIAAVPHYILAGDNERRIHTLKKLLGLPSESMWDNYVAFEGLPGAGKTTQIRSLVAFLEDQGYDYHLCQRYGTPALKEELKRLYADPVANRDRLLQLHLESFMEQFEKNRVKERLEAGQLVITDRSKYTAMTVQMALGADLGRVYHALRGLPAPGRVVYVAVSPEVAATRNKVLARESNPLKGDVAFQRKVADAYGYFMEHQPDFLAINGQRPVEWVQSQVRAALDITFNFEKAAEAAVAMNKRYPAIGTKPWSHLEAACDLSYQVGTLHKTLLQLRGAVWPEGMTEAQLLEKVSLDVGDILACTLAMAKELGINPEVAWQANRREDAQKIRDRVTITPDEIEQLVCR